MRILSNLLKVYVFGLVILFTERVSAQRFQQQQQARPQLCYTPDNYYGLCVVLTQCPSVVNIYGNSRGSQAAYQYILQTQRACGTRSIGRDPVVCCGEAYNNYYRQPQTTTPRNVNPFTTQSPFIRPTQPPTRPTEPPTQPTPPPTRATQPTTSIPIIAPTPDNRVTTTNCYGPDSLGGYCTDLRQCQKLLDWLVNSPGNDTVAQYLRLSNEICRSHGFSTGNSVCCITETVEYFHTSTTSSPVVTTPRNANINNGGSGSSGLLNAPECGISPAFDFKRIVGGRPAKLHAWPWATLLAYDILDGTSPFKCGGALVSSRHVVTAAHCIRSDLQYVRLGEHDLSTDTESQHVDIKISKIDRHPSYNSRNGKNDIAVLHLERPVSFSTTITPICLPINEPLRSKSYVDHTPFVAGWGRTEEAGSSSQVLLELQLPVLERSVCIQKYQEQRRLVTEDQFDDAVLCAGSLAGGKDTCQGDSGGPLMLPERVNSTFKFNLIGVVSYGVGCARPDIPSAYTNVPHFVDWIQEKVNNS